MSKRIGIIALLLCLIAVGLSAAALTVALDRAEPGKAEQEVQYVLYLGTNGKDSNEPVFPPEDAKTEAEKVLLAHFGGYTIQEANGGWIDGDTVFREYTLVIYLSDTTEAAVHAAADELLRVFDQSSVLIQANKTTTEFYAGAEE